MNYPVITLCGSTKFKDQFIAEQKRLTLEGNIVISVGLFGHSGDDEVWTDDTKEMLDAMHKEKILMANKVFVINVDGYIGSSTRSEIEFAMDRGVPIEYLVSEKPLTPYLEYPTEKINFCEMSEDELQKIFDFIGKGVLEVVKNSSVETKLLGTTIIEKKWNHWDEVIVTPKEIFFAPDPQPRQSIMTAEKYLKLKAF